MFKYICSTLLVIGIGLFFLIGVNQNVLADDEQLRTNDNFIDPQVDEVNTKLLQLDTKLHELFGENVTVNALGYIKVDEKGIIQVNLKKEFEGTAKSSYSSKNELIKWMESQGIVVTISAIYSEDELTTISDQIMADITLYYDSDFPKDFTLAVEPDVEKQIIRLKYDFSNKSALDSKLLKKLETKYPAILVTEDTTYENVKFTRNKNDNYGHSTTGI